MAPAIISDPETPPAGASSPLAAPGLFSLQGKTVAITGGARGLGITLATAVVEARGSVACLDILETPSAEEWAVLTKLAAAQGSTVSYTRCDVTDEVAVHQVMDSIALSAEAAGAPFWGTIACAGIQQQLPALEYPAADFNRILGVNVTGVFNTCKAAARVLTTAKRPGSIVIISSMSGNIANRVCIAAVVDSSALHLTNQPGPFMHSIQLEQGCRPADVSLRCTGMGPIRHPCQHAVSGCKF